MNEYLLSVLLGIIEGLTEFLPVSSTAHLRIAEALFGMDLSNGYWKMFSIVIQLGAILCLPIYFRKHIARLLSSFPNRGSGERPCITHPLTLTLVAFLFTAVPSFLLTKIIGKNLESLFVMAGSLVIGGIIMWVVDALYDRQVLSSAANRTDEMDKMTMFQAIWVGACQTLSAVFPGTSRSMSTIAAGQLVRMSRPAALEFSFFLSIPTMVAATLYDLYKSVFHAHNNGNPIGAMHIDAHGWTLLAIGFVVSFIVAYGVVAWFMNWVRTRGFVPFAIYRIIFGIIVLGWAFSLR